MSDPHRAGSHVCNNSRSMVQVWSMSLVRVRDKKERGRAPLRPGPNACGTAEPMAPQKTMPKTMPQKTLPGDELARHIPLRIVFVMKKKAINVINNVMFTTSVPIRLQCWVNHDACFHVAPRHSQASSQNVPRSNRAAPAPSPPSSDHDAAAHVAAAPDVAVRRLAASRDRTTCPKGPRVTAQRLAASQNTAATKHSSQNPSLN